MALKQTTTVESGTCDACGANLCRLLWLLAAAAPVKRADYGALRSHFGYGSGRDACGERTHWEICGECWDKALGALGLLRKQ